MKSKLRLSRLFLSCCLHCHSVQLTLAFLRIWIWRHPIIDVLGQWVTPAWWFGTLLPMAKRQHPKRPHNNKQYWQSHFIFQIHQIFTSFLQEVCVYIQSAVVMQNLIRCFGHTSYRNHHCCGACQTCCLHSDHLNTVPHHICPLLLIVHMYTFSILLAQNRAQCSALPLS